MTESDPLLDKTSTGALLFPAGDNGELERPLLAEADAAPEQQEEERAEEARGAAEALEDDSPDGGEPQASSSHAQETAEEAAAASPSSSVPVQFRTRLPHHFDVRGLEFGVPVWTLHVGPLPVGSIGQMERGLAALVLGIQTRGHLWDRPALFRRLHHHHAGRRAVDWLDPQTVARGAPLAGSRVRDLRQSHRGGRAPFHCAAGVHRGTAHGRGLFVLRLFDAAVGRTNVPVCGRVQGLRATPAVGLATVLAHDCVVDVSFGVYSGHDIPHSA